MSDFVQSLILSRHKPLLPPHIGDRVDVHVRIFESEKERIQIFRGIVLKINGQGANKSFTVRKISDGIGVERTFPLASPILAKIDVLSRSKVRRSKLYFIRNLKGRASRLAGAFLQDKESAEQTSDQTASSDSSLKENKIADSQTSSEVSSSPKENSEKNSKAPSSESFKK